MLKGIFILSYVALWTLIIVLYGAVILLYRYLAADVLPKEGPKIGKPVNLNLTTAEGRTYQIGGDSGRGVPHLVVFSQPNCRYCERLRQLLTEVPKADTQIVVVYSADEQRTRTYVEKFAGRVIVVPDPSADLARGWGVTRMPYLVGIDLSGIIVSKGEMTSAETLKQFLEQVGQANRKGAETIVLTQSA